jgi:WD40 repeat protein
MKTFHILVMLIVLTWLVACAQQPSILATKTTQPTAFEGESTPLPPTITEPAIPLSPASPQAGQTIPTSPAKLQFSSPQVITHGEIQDIAASPDGRWMAVASASGLYLHNAQTLALERALLDDVWVSGVAFSPDGRSLAAYGSNWLRLFELSSAQTTKQVEVSVQKLEFAPDGKSLIGLDGWSSPASLRIWELPGWEERQVLFDVQDAPRSMAVSPDGKSVALGGVYGWVELFDLGSAARLAVLSEWTGLPVTDLAYSPDGDFLAAARTSIDCSLDVWSVTGRKKVVEHYTVGSFGREPFVAFSADGQRLLAGTGDLVIVWERGSDQELGALHGYASFLMDLVISPGGDRLAYVTYNWPVYIQDLESQALPQILSVKYYEAFNVGFKPDGKSVAVGLYSYAPESLAVESAEMVRLWDTRSGEDIQMFSGAIAAAYSPDGQHLALADTGGLLQVIDLDGGMEICLPGCACSFAGGGEDAKGCSLKLPHDLSPMELSYSPDGSLLAIWGVAGSWGASSLIDLSTGDEVAWFEGGSRISFGPNNLIALGVDELNADHGIAARWLVLYDLWNSKELQRVKIPADGVAALSPDGKWLAVGLSSFEKTNPTGQDPPDPSQNGLMIWDVEAWRQVAYYPKPYGITRLAFSPQGDFLITASETGEILRWNRIP